jgi:hypothetical protein
MASHYKLHDGVGEVVPWSAKYSYPTQASRAWKTVVKVTPKNGAEFVGRAGTTIRFELPAQSYLNTRNTGLQFDVALKCGTADANARFQNNIQSIIRRARIYYGSLVLEDLRSYNVLMRVLTEGAANSPNLSIDQSSICEGIGGATNFGATIDNARLLAIQGSKLADARADAKAPSTYTDGDGTVSQRRYHVQLGFGLTQQAKLLPLKWMASQVAIELELADYVECVAQEKPYNPLTDSYTLTNMHMLLELQEFDGAYDETFLEGLRSPGGV